MTTETTTTETKVDIDWTDETARKAAIQAEIDAAVGDLTGLKKQNSELIGFKRQFAEVDLEEYKTLKQQREEMDRKNAEKKGEYEKLREKDTAAFAVKEAKMLAALDERARKAEAVAAINTAGGNVKLLLPHVLEQTRFDADTYGVQVIGLDGLPVDGGSIQALVEAMKTDPDYGHAFRSTQAQGGGAENITPSALGGIVNPYAAATFNLTDQGKLEKSNPVLAAQLRAQAG